MAGKYADHMAHIIGYSGYYIGPFGGIYSGASAGRLTKKVLFEKYTRSGVYYVALSDDIGKKRNRRYTTVVLQNLGALETIKRHKWNKYFASTLREAYKNLTEEEKQHPKVLEKFPNVTIETTLGELL